MSNDKVGRKVRIYGSPWYEGKIYNELGDNNDTHSASRHDGTLVGILEGYVAVELKNGLVVVANPKQLRFVKEKS